MLNRQKTITALESKQPQFQQFLETKAVQNRSLNEQLDLFDRYTYESLSAQLALCETLWPGALPTLEFDQAQNRCLPFAERWHSHQDARAWALATLYNRPVIAVDGSQITPTKDFSIPIGAVQIGWFINEHREGRGGYIKDVDFEVMTPQELTDEDDTADVEGGFPDWRVNQARFVRECEKLCMLMASYASEADERKPLCFFDGSFAISFAGQLRPERAQPYIRAIQNLLYCSKQYRVPLIGFVDSSYSRDIIRLIETVSTQPNKLSISDAGMLSPFLPNWGDRSPIFLCARLDSLSRDGKVPFYPEIAFTYVRLVQDQPPARLEMPKWVVDAGRAEEIIDLVRAECVVGTGYPYAIETADALAVISVQDRQRFYALFQQFAEREGLDLTLARKARSKQNRR